MALCTSALAQQPSVRKVALLSSGKQVELEIAVSQPTTPVARVVTGPDRVAFDFANFVPAKELRNLLVRRGGVRGASQSRDQGDHSGPAPRPRAGRRDLHLLRRARGRAGHVGARLLTETFVRVFSPMV